MRRSRRGEPVAVEGSRRQARGSHGGVEVEEGRGGGDARG